MVAVVADFQQRGFRLRNVGAGDDLRNIHHGEQWSTGRDHLSGVERAVGHHAIHGTADFGITELRGRAQIFALGGFQLSRRGFQRLLFSHFHQRVEMLLCAISYWLRALVRSTPAWSSSLRGIAPC